MVSSRDSSLLRSLPWSNPDQNDMHTKATKAAPGPRPMLKPQHTRDRTQL
ncbi:hypothetical protein BN1708_002203 [Verticillium longisporum]|uniref:Uncharacterized protein n=1 Tax=Verticillium longisporum TaxID=100787 RepID=A0A0G4KMA9_VERLO|nr:hypothetical protein BN1708_002203 [Verticillium longisporum]